MLLRTKWVMLISISVTGNRRDDAHIVISEISLVSFGSIFGLLEAALGFSWSIWLVKH